MRRSFAVGAAVLLVAGFATHREHARADAADARFVTAPCDLRSLASSCDAGWRVHVDPKTGRYSIPAAATSAVSASDATGAARELVVVPGTSPAGGYLIRLDGSTGTTLEQR